MQPPVVRATQHASLLTSVIPQPTQQVHFSSHTGQQRNIIEDVLVTTAQNVSSTARGILIGILSALGSALIVTLLLAIFYFFRYTRRGRILLDRIGRPGEYDDEQAFAKEEAEALEEMDDMQRAEYMRAKAYVQANPPESAQTDISLSQFLAIQEKGVSAWEFEPELEIANCFVEGRTEIEFFDSECSVQSNLPVPKQNEVYYWEAKIYDKPESTTIGIGVTTKPYPLFRMPGFHKTSVAYMSSGDRRFNQPFKPLRNYGPPYVQGDVVGVGYRPRTGTVFFTRNGKKLEEVTHSLKSQNLFPTIGATGPCTIHVNFGQMGFVFIEANVKKWGLAPMTGSLAPPPPYGSEQGSILLEGGQAGVAEGQGYLNAGWVEGSNQGHSRSRSAQFRLARQPPTSPGPKRSPTDISLTQLSLVDQEDASDSEDAGEGTSASNSHPGTRVALNQHQGLGFVDFPVTAPPEYTSPESEESHRNSYVEDGEERFPHRHSSRTTNTRNGNEEERQRLLQRPRQSPPSPPIPSYDVAVGNAPQTSGRRFTR